MKHASRNRVILNRKAYGIYMQTIKSREVNKNKNTQRNFSDMIFPL